jgi:hypothetical protein
MRMIFDVDAAAGRLETDLNQYTEDCSHGRALHSGRLSALASIELDH